MCKTKMATNAIPPSPSSRNSSNRHRTPTTSTTTTSVTATTTTTTSHSSRRSLTSLRSSLPENPHLYDISEIRKATNNFLTKNYSTSTSSRSWKCNLKGKDVIIFQRKNHHPETPSSIRQKLSSICKYHHSAIVNLLGASVSGEYIYLVYEFINGASLYELLHNRNNPNFTVLNTWMSRMQIATDLAHGLDYIHNNSGLDVTFVHNRIKSSSVIVTEPSLNAKISHFGTSELCNEPVEDREYQSTDKNIKIDEEHDEIEDETEKKLSPAKKSLVRSNSIKFHGTRGYMSPEFKSTGIGTRKSDIYAFGIILLELISGGEPIKYKYDKNLKEYVKISAVENAFAVADTSGGGSEERERRLRKFVDRRLQDSYPIQVALKLLRIALDCLHVDPTQRPDMRRVAGKISKLYLESKGWCEQLNLNFDISVSMGPR